MRGIGGGQAKQVKRAILADQRLAGLEQSQRIGRRRALERRGIDCRVIRERQKSVRALRSGCSDPRQRAQVFAVEKSIRQRRDRRNKFKFSLDLLRELEHVIEAVIRHA